jgi:hypothetical protein
MKALMPYYRNRKLSIRSRKGKSDSSDAPKHHFAISSLRGLQQPELSKKLFKLIKSENHAINAYETAGRERLSIASQLSEWGEETNDDAISEISDKLGVLLAEMGEQEDNFAQGLEEYRGILKQIRNTEGSVQPTRDQKTKVYLGFPLNHHERYTNEVEKISDELQKLKYKEPTSTKIPSLEQELVRVEAQSLVAEAQLTNITRKKFREAYATHLAAVLERSEKQAILAKQAQRLLILLDDSPIIPGEAHEPFSKTEEARQVLNEAEAELKQWTPSWTLPQSQSATGPDGMAMPQSATSTTGEEDLYSDPRTEGSVADTTTAQVDVPTSHHQEATPVKA